MRILMLFIFSIIPFELFAQKTKGNTADSVIVCKSKQALGLPAMDRYARGFKYIQQLPSEGQYVLKPLKKYIDLAELTNGQVGGFFTHKYTSEGSIISYNDGENGLCWVGDLEAQQLSCKKFYEFGVGPVIFKLILEEIENRDLSKSEIDQIIYFVGGMVFEDLKIMGKRFIARDRIFRDCDGVFCSRKQHALLERGTCSVY